MSGFNETALGSGNDTFGGTSGNDSVLGENGNDSILGIDGNDILDGGNGADTLEGGAGDDRLNGGEGFDWVSYANAGGGVSVVADSLGNGNATGADGNDVLISIQGVTGSAFNDTLSNVLFCERGRRK